MEKSSTQRSVQTMVLGSKSVLSLLSMDPAELAKTYGKPVSLRVHADGSVERIWNVESGSLEVTHSVNGKATDVRFFSNVSSSQLRAIMGPMP